MKKKLLTFLLFGVTTLTAFAQVPSYVPTNGLVGYWPFNGNADDESGNGNNGTVNGATLTADRNGVADKAYSFDGINDNILVNNSVSLNMPSITIAGWVNLHTSPTGIAGQAGDVALVNKWYQQINCNDKNDSYNIEIARVNNSPVLLGATTLYSGTTFASNTSLSLDNWVYFTFAHNSSIGGKLYMNGILVASNTLSGAICNSTNSLYFGADNNKGVLWRFLNGKLDDIGIWNRALTQQEITTLYQGCSNPTVTLTGLNPYSLKTSSPISLVGNPSGGTYSGESVLGSTFIPANATLGKKTISYNYTTPEGCSGSAVQTTIVVDSVGNVCSTYDTLKIKVHFTLGLYANTTNTIKFYPNPTKEILFIDNGNYKAMSGYSIKIVSLTGAVVYNQPITSQQVQISMNQFATKGLYIAQILDSNNAIVDSKKIVLE